MFPELIFSNKEYKIRSAIVITSLLIGIAFSAVAFAYRDRSISLYLLIPSLVSLCTVAAVICSCNVWSDKDAKRKLRETVDDKIQKVKHELPAISRGVTFFAPINLIKGVNNNSSSKKEEVFTNNHDLQDMKAMC